MYCVKDKFDFGISISLAGDGLSVSMYSLEEGEGRCALAPCLRPH